MTRLIGHRDFAELGEVRVEPLAFAK